MMTANSKGVLCLYGMLKRFGSNTVAITFFCITLLCNSSTGSKSFTAVKAYGKAIQQGNAYDTCLLQKFFHNAKIRNSGELVFDEAVKLLIVF